MEIYLAVLAGSGGMLGWGLADFFAKKTVGRLSAVKTYLYSHIFGLALLLICFAFNQEPVSLGPQIILFLILFGIGDLIGYTLFYRGLQKGMVSVIGPIVATNGGIAVLVSFFLFDETITLIHWIGLGVVFIGTILISFQLQEGGMNLSIKKMARGLPEAIISMIIYGFFFPCWDWFLGYQNNGLVTSLILVSFVSIIGSFLFIYLFSGIKRIPADAGVKGKQTWFWLALIGIFTISASLAVAWGYKFTTITSIVVVISAAFPLPTIILARIFLKEKLTKNQFIGAATIIAGLIVLALVK